MNGNFQLKVTNLVKYYKKRRVVNSLSLSISPAEIVGLLGPNGAGKTTTFYMIVGLISPDSGRITFDGADITEYPMYKRSRMGIGYLSQEPSVFRKLTVEDNIMAVLETLNLRAEERRERCDTLLDDLSIKHLRKNRAFTLSGGERRRLEITRALVTDPRFILLDEPFSGIDPIAVDEIQAIVRRLRDKGLGVLITDHNVRDTLEITNRAYIIYEGEIQVSGNAHELVNDPRARKLYLGDDFSL